MKKAVLLLAMFSLVLLTSCTDNTEENLVNEKKSQLIDPVETGEPGEDDTEEG